MAGCVLAALVVPITTSVAREVYSRTPRDLIDTCFALGGTKWGAIRSVVIPYGKSGVIAGAMLGLGRALGETVAIYLMLNLVFDYSNEILDSAGGNVASMIALKFGDGQYDRFEHRAKIDAARMNFVPALDQYPGIEPLRPWAVTRSTRLKNLSRLAVFAFVAFLVTIITPLAKIDGWAVAFLLINVAWGVGQNSRLGAKERRDAVLR
ncbi:MAG: ABC transporter permease subunit, partial [Burkholderiaceae bacterium]|nr:ABC transporter permease subunit [Burkholderiaceae bacterium]